VNTAEITYNSTYPTVGFAPALTNLGGTLGVACVPSSTTACLVDAVLSNNGSPAGSGKSGYKFSTGAGTVSGGVKVGYAVLAVPLVLNRTGIRAFCAVEDGVVRVDPAGACSIRRSAADQRFYAPFRESPSVSSCSAEMG
jgi:hypothetical protein